MTEQEIIQNAEEYANRYEIRGTSEGEFRYMDKRDAYIVGAHSRDAEINELKKKLEDMTALKNFFASSLDIYDKDNKELQGELKILHNPWISAADRLPKTKEDSPSGIIFAMCNDSYDLDDTHSSISCLIPCIFVCVEVDENEYQWESTMDYGYKIEDIFKWMPIPKSKEGE